MPLFKGLSSKSTSKKAIDYITRGDKAAYVSVRNLFEDEDYAEQFADTMRLFGKGKKFDERKYYHFKLTVNRLSVCVSCYNALVIYRLSEEGKKQKNERGTTYNPQGRDKLERRFTGGYRRSKADIYHAEGIYCSLKVVRRGSDEEQDGIFFPSPRKEKSHPRA